MRSAAWDFPDLVISIRPQAVDKEQANWMKDKGTLIIRDEFISPASMIAALRFATNSGIAFSRATSDGDGGMVIYEREGEDEISYDVDRNGVIERVEFQGGKRVSRSRVS